MRNTKHIFYGLLLASFLLGLHDLNAQTRQVEVLFDSTNRRVKERYNVLEDKPSVLSGNYESYYLDGGLKNKGQYENGKAIGTWQYFFENGKLKSEASIESDSDIYWKYFFENGTVSHEGTVINGQKSGLWTYYYESGEVKSRGYFTKDIREGIWKNYYEDNRLKGQAVYENNRAWYQEFYPDGVIKMEGRIADGKSDSIWTYYHSNGNIMAKGLEKEGLKDGQWINYYPNGEKESEGDFLEGQKNGPWKFYHDNGQISALGELKEDKKDGYWKLFYSSGASMAEGQYDEGTGAYTEYYESGKVKVKGFVQNSMNDSTWTFYYEDGTLEGSSDYEDGVGNYVGYYKDGSVKMKGQLKEGEKIGTWQLFDEKGKLAGLYKTYYDEEEPIIETVEPSPSQNESRAREGESSKPSYKFKSKKRIRYFEPRINEYRSFILSTNPLQTLFGSFPVSLEYYYQERLGYELKVAYIRDPFFITNSNVGSDIPYRRGFSIDLRQKFYFEKNIYGLLYFGHELRYESSSYGVNIPSLEGLFKPVLNEDIFSYSIVAGNRIMESHANKGFTLDIWGGIGIGYRYITKNWTDIPAVDRGYSSVNQEVLALPIKLGFTVGYVFKYNRSPLYN